MQQSELQQTLNVKSTPTMITLWELLGRSPHDIKKIQDYLCIICPSKSNTARRTCPTTKSTRKSQVKILSGDPNISLRNAILSKFDVVHKWTHGRTLINIDVRNGIPWISYIWDTHFPSTRDGRSKPLTQLDSEALRRERKRDAEYVSHRCLGIYPC